MEKCPMNNGGGNTAALYQAPEVYPPIAVTCRNPRYAQMMMNSMSGEISETTAVTQYCYQSWLLTCQCPEIAAALSGIAKVEMHHLSILGQLICQLGGNPRFFSVQQNRIVPWSSKYVPRCTTADAVLQSGIRGEQITIANYQGLIQRIDDTCVTDNLQRIILDEEVHIQCLQLLLADCQG